MTTSIQIKTKAPKINNQVYATTLIITDFPDNVVDVIKSHAVSNMVVMFQNELRSALKKGEGFKSSEWTGNVERTVESFRPTGRGDIVKQQDTAKLKMMKAHNLDEAKYDAMMEWMKTNV